MNATITKTGDFRREVEINRIDALEGSYHLEFSSLLLNAKDPTAVQKNFGLILKMDDLRMLGNLINEALQEATA